MVVPGRFAGAVPGHAGILPASLSLDKARGAVWYPPAGEALDMETHVAKRCILIGTAGGFADTITGQTLWPSIRSAMIGAEAVARPQVIKKLWDYIKAKGLQDAANKRAINADAKLLPIFGKPQITMFELAGIVGKHLA